MAETRQSVKCSRSLKAMSNSSVFKVRFKALRSSADRQLYDREFQTEGALTLNAFADNTSVILSFLCTKSNNLSDDHNVPLYHAYPTFFRP